MIDQKLISAAEHFRNTGEVHTDVLPLNLMPASLPPDILESMAVFQFAMAGNMMRTCRACVEQMRVCFEISHFLQFYTGDIGPHLGFWVECGLLNGSMLTNSAHIYTNDIANLRQYLEIAIEAHNQRDATARDNGRARLIAAINEAQSIQEDAKGAIERIRHFSARSTGGKLLFDASEKQPLPDGQSAEVHAKALFGRSAMLCEEMIDACEDTLRTKLARAFYIQTVVVPNEPSDVDKWVEDTNDAQGMVNPLIERLRTYSQSYTTTEWMTQLTFAPILPT